MSEDNTMSLASLNNPSEEENNSNTVQEKQDPKQQVISVDNPSQEEMQEIVKHIQVNYDFDVEVRPTEFRFKKSKDKETGIETVREPVVLPVPYPSVQGIVNILERGGKELELLKEAVEGVITSAVRDLLNDDYKLNATNFPAEKVSWEYIANLPKAQRRGGGIPKETWEAFAQDYCEVMPEVTGKSLDQVATAAKLFTTRLANVKTNKPVLEFLVSQLSIYADKSENAAEFQEVIEFLLEKADNFLNLSDEDLLANL